METHWRTLDCRVLSWETQADFSVSVPTAVKPVAMVSFLLVRRVVQPRERGDGQPLSPACGFCLVHS